MTDQPSQPQFDALLPPAMAVQAEEIGVKKASLDWPSTFALAILAGGFIAIGGIFASVVSTGPLPYGVARCLAGLAFGTGLIMVVVGGGELFTGNILIVMAFASRRISWRALLRNWLIVYLGNFVGAFGTACAMFLSRHYLLGGGEVGMTMLKIGEAKTALCFVPALILGIFCNALVCMAVWMCYGARTTAGKVLAILTPIAAFVAASFEHSIANMYFIPVALFVKQFAAPEFFQAIHHQAADFSHLTWERFLWANLLPVTIGNIIGGAVLVGAMYWFVYLRHRPRPVENSGTDIPPVR